MTKRYFQDPAMQQMYERLIKDGKHHNAALREVEQRFANYDNQTQI